jgi:hypothetical protein
VGKLVITNQHRGHNEGHFRLRKDGRWECQFTLPNGKVKSVYGKTRPEVRTKMEEALGKAKKGIDLKGERQTLNHFLSTWMEETAKPKLRPSTIKSYESYIRLHIVPALGNTTLGDLTAQDVQRFLNGRTKSVLQNPRRKLLGVIRRVGDGHDRSPGGQASPLDQRTVSMSWISSHRRPLPSWEKRTAVPGSSPLAMR